MNDDLDIQIRLLDLKKTRKTALERRLGKAGQNVQSCQLASEKSQIAAAKQSAKVDGYVQTRLKEHKFSSSEQPSSSHLRCDIFAGFAYERARLAQSIDTHDDDKMNHADAMRQYKDVAQEFAKATIAFNSFESHLETQIQYCDDQLEDSDEEEIQDIASGRS